MYQHRYCVTNCPNCNNDLTAANAVEIVAMNDLGHSMGQHKSSLDATGLLIDVSNIVANGYHSDTECAKCGESLALEENCEVPATPTSEIGNLVAKAHNDNIQNRKD